jgi:glucose/arabinose dehydrogenase
LLVANFLGTIFHFKLNQNRTELALSNQWNDKIASDDEVLEAVIFGTSFGTIRDLEVGPDGYLLYVLSGTREPEGKIYKILTVVKKMYNYVS